MGRLGLSGCAAVCFLVLCLAEGCRPVSPPTSAAPAAPAANTTSATASVVANAARRATNPNPQARPAWAYVSGGKLLLGDGSGTAVVLSDSAVDASAAAAAVTADGGTLAWTVGTGEISVTDRTGKRLRGIALSQKDDRWGGVQLVWSPLGDRLAYTDDGYLWVADAGGKRTKLTQGRGVTGFAWSPDGTALAVGRRGDLDKDLGLWRISLTGGKAVRLAPPSGDVFAATAPVWSPDGRNIAFLRAWEGGTLCFASADGSKKRLNIAPAWFPISWLDGKTVMYEEGSPEESSAGIRRCSLTGKPQSVYDGEVCSYGYRDGKLGVLTPEKAAGSKGTVTQVRVRVYSDVGGKPKLVRSQAFDGSWGTLVMGGGGRLAVVTNAGYGTPGVMHIVDTSGSGPAELTPLLQKVDAVVGWVQ